MFSGSGSGSGAVSGGAAAPAQVCRCGAGFGRPARAQNRSLTALGPARRCCPDPPAAATYTASQRPSARLCAAARPSLGAFGSCLASGCGAAAASFAKSVGLRGPNFSNMHACLIPTHCWGALAGLCGQHRAAAGQREHYNGSIASSHVRLCGAVLPPERNVTPLRHSHSRRAAVLWGRAARRRRNARIFSWHSMTLDRRSCRRCLAATDQF